jgi:hypothetical protein
MCFPVIPKFRGSDISGIQNGKFGGEFVALGPGSRALAFGRDDK